MIKPDSNKTTKKRALFKVNDICGEKNLKDNMASFNTAYLKNVKRFWILPLGYIFIIWDITFQHPV